MIKVNAQDILLKYNAGIATDKEKALVEHWILNYVDDTSDLTDEELLNDLLEIRQRLDTAIYAAPKARRLWPVITAAASIVILLTAGLLYYNTESTTTKSTSILAKNDVLPGGDRAILTLSNGERIVLNSAANGKLAEQGNALIKKNANGSVVYNVSEAADGDMVTAYNTMSTPRGGQYHLVLADGTNVWLNAQSSIRYPALFSGKMRRVELTGEAYFEVAHNAAMPFIVTSGGQTVEVLGTHFNINAYADGGVIKTTLLEGSVKVSVQGKSNLLKPGQQAQTWVNNGKTNVELLNNDDAQIAVAWKNGLFSFNNTETKEVMQQLARWYDVDVVYEDNIPDTRFSGKIHRNINASKALEILRFTGLKFRIENKKIIVTP